MTETQESPKVTISSTVRKIHAEHPNLTAVEVAALASNEVGREVTKGLVYTIFMNERNKALGKKQKRKARTVSAAASANGNQPIALHEPPQGEATPNAVPTSPLAETVATLKRIGQKIGPEETCNLIRAIFS